MNKPRTPGEIAQWLAAVVESSDDAIVSKDLDGLITSWNPAAERMFGFTAAEAIGQPITIIIPPDRRQEEREILSRLRQGQAIDHVETVRITKGGRTLDVSLTVSPVRTDEGAIIGASKIARDITDRKRLEAEHTELLAREQAAREEAETLNRSKDEFLAVLSHELRTPLNAIYGWAHMLHNSPADARTMTRGMEAILRNAQAQLQLVEDLLDVSRIITGTMQLEKQPVELTAVVEAAFDAVRPSASAQGVRLHAPAGPAPVVVMGAADRLRQVVANLLMNAVKFTPPGGSVTVELHRTETHAELVVSDTGEGIDPELLPYVFDRFRQADTSSTRRHGGLGLGLALVRHLVDLHGGTVRADSRGLGRGATFTVQLPLAATDGQAAEVMERLPDVTRLDAISVLVVDDDIDGLELTELILVSAGATVRTCNSGTTALALLDEWRPQVLVLDIEMPGMDGYALLKTIHARFAKIPALALTAYGRNEDRQRAFAAGFSLHLAKPVAAETLRTAIATLASLSG